MRQMEVICELDVFEYDGDKILHGGKAPRVRIYSHNEMDSLVRLCVEGHIYTLEVAEIKKAIENCSNSRLV